MSMHETLTTILVAVPFAAWLIVAADALRRWHRAEVRPRRRRARLRLVPPPPPPR